MRKKQCSKCNLLLPISQFYKRTKGSRDGYQSRCKTCHKQYRQQHYQENRKKYLKKASEWNKRERQRWSKFKATLRCSICREDHPACIEFHHNDGRKEHNIANMVGRYKMSTILKEITKCDILCANCHRKTHFPAAVV